MATVKIDQFGGIAPRQHPTLLADGMAVTAHNCRLVSGKLVPLRKPGTANVKVYLENGLNKSADAKSIHVWRKQDGTFDILAFPGVTWAANGNIADDDFTRIIISGDTDGDGKAEEPVVYARRTSLGRETVETLVLSKDALPKPVARRKAGVLDPSDKTATHRFTCFFLTWVDRYGYESPVSDPSDEIEYYDGDAIVIDPVGVGNIPSDAVSVRVYKVVAGTEEGRIQFIEERRKFDLGNGAYGMEFKVKDENAGEVIPEIESPPRDLTCIHEVPGAFYCGFSPSAPKTVCFSDINLIYSWPLAYRYDVGDNLKALAVTSNTVYALTDGWPYVLSGTAPESMTVAKLAGPAACVSERGVCVFRNAVYFVSNVGLMSIFNSADAGTVCQNLTEKYFSKDQWLAFNPESAVMWQYDGTLYISFEPQEGGTKGLCVNLMENAQIAVTTHGVRVECVAVDNATDRKYFVGSLAGEEA